MAAATTELLGLGIYSVPEASRLVDISQPRLRRWYDFVREGETHHSGPVIEGELPEIDQVVALSFLDLQEARCIEEFRKRHVGWVALRDAHQKAKLRLRTSHPFCTGRFKTVGRTIMLDSAESEGDGYLEDIARSQRTFRTFLQPYLRSLEFLGDRPVMWYPLVGSRRVVLDPKRSFGHPIVAKRGVPTCILASAHKAEGSYEKVADWYDVDVRSVRDAVKYERLLVA